MRDDTLDLAVDVRMSLCKLDDIARSMAVAIDMIDPALPTDGSSQASSSM